jgi:hypothetical protein
VGHPRLSFLAAPMRGDLGALMPHNICGHRLDGTAFIQRPSLTCAKAKKFDFQPLAGDTLKEHDTNPFRQPQPAARYR